MNWSRPERCELCGNTSDLRWSLVKWRDAPPGMAYQHIARCHDEAACRSRLEDLDEDWPLAERKGSAA